MLFKLLKLDKNSYNFHACKIEKDIVTVLEKFGLFCTERSTNNLRSCKYRSIFNFVQFLLKKVYTNMFILISKFTHSPGSGPIKIDMIFINFWYITLKVFYNIALKSKYSYSGNKWLILQITIYPTFVIKFISN